MQYQFYAHPFIELMVNDPWMKKHELFKRSGIRDKRIFNSEYRKLKNEKHFQEDHGKYSLAALSLLVSLKENGAFIDRISIKYIPQHELQSMFGFIRSGNEPEDSFGFKLFVEYIQVKEAFKNYFERENDISLHMEQYDYYLSAEYIDLQYQNVQADRSKHITIILLCDDQVLAEELEKHLKEKYLHDVTLLHFFQADDAARVLQNKFAGNEAVNLIITDIDLNETEGYQFAITVRELEMVHNNFPVPVIAISSLENNEEKLNIGLGEKLFNLHYKKNNDIQADCKKIVDYIKGVFWTNIFLY